MKEKKIFITGLGIYSPAGYGINQVWTNVLNDKNRLERKTTWTNPQIRSHYYGVPPVVPSEDAIKWNEMFKPTYYSQLGMYACHKAIEDAQIELSATDNEIGMVIDTSMGSSSSVEEYLLDFYQRGLSKISPMKFIKTVTNTAIGDISRFFKLNGPSSLLLNECSLCYGVDILEKGSADIVICGAIDHYIDYYILSEQETNCLVDDNLSMEEAIANTKEVDRKILGEGACFIILETEESIKKRGVTPYAELIEYKTTFDPENILSTSKRKVSTLERNLSQLCNSVPDYSNILWLSAFQTEVQRETSEPEDLINTVSKGTKTFINHKKYTGDMRSASSLFGIAIASKSLKEQKTPYNNSQDQTELLDMAIVNTVQEGGSSSLFLLKNHH